MFLVGGGIIAHGIAPLHHLIEKVGAMAGAVPAVGWLLGFLATTIANSIVGIVAGGLVVLVVIGVTRVVKKQPAGH
jgi:predicted DNA repair protein MutK